jgi:hypothetical protein
MASFKASGLVNTLVKTSKAIDTNWFDTDISVGGPNYNNYVFKHSLQIRVSNDTVLNLQYVYGGVTETYDLNSGVAQPGGAVHVYDILLPSGASYNIQHKTDTQDVTCIIAETNTANIG